MARIRYYYDTEKCRYERVEVKARAIILNILGFLSMAFLLAVGMTFLYYKYFPSPKYTFLKSKYDILTSNYTKLDKDLADINQALYLLEEQDREVYRTVYEVEPPVKDSFRLKKVDYGKITDIIEVRNLVLSKLDKIHQLKEKILYQDKSYIELLAIAKDKEKFLSSQPAIQPVSNKTLKRLASGFGWRTHPVYKVKKFHKGIDFTASRGTPIFATGSGKVFRIEHKLTGYGTNVIIDHGFGYKTRYAHMQKVYVKKGQKLKRGDEIGEVGSTGTSTGPHVHYEVYKNGKVVNPVYYFFNDLSEEEYEEILRQANIENQSM